MKSFSRSTPIRKNPRLFSQHFLFAKKGSMQSLSTTSKYLAQWRRWSHTTEWKISLRLHGAASVHWSPRFLRTILHFSKASCSASAICTDASWLLTPASAPNTPATAMLCQAACTAAREEPAAAKSLPDCARCCFTTGGLSCKGRQLAPLHLRVYRPIPIFSIPKTFVCETLIRRTSANTRKLHGRADLAVREA